MANQRTSFLAFFLLMMLNLPSLQAAAPQLPDLNGTWSGAIKNEAQGEIKLSILFQHNKATLSMGETTNATYVFADNTITFLFDDGVNEPIRLTSVQIKDGTLTADVRFLLGPEDLSGKMTLTKGAKFSPSAPTRKVCNNPNINSAVLELLGRFQLDCPIEVPGTEDSFKTAIVIGFLQQVAKTYSPTLDSLRVDYRGGVIYVTTSSQPVRDGLRTIRTYLFQNPESLKLGDPGGPFNATNIRSVGDLDPALLTNYKVNFGAVWGRIINAGESVQGLRFDPATESSSGVNRQIQTFWRRVGQDQSYVYFERVSVKMKDQYANIENGAGSSVRVDVISEIVRRSGYSSTRQSLDCSLGGDFQGAKLFVCSESPVMQAILNKIKR